ncbi:SLC13 family permease [Nonomuraea jiangxiensis]|uniref:Dicarboxylate carrier protein MatC N-terminus n=1 Tax=Nonomuraea jiangxiensis TaxID=633440 RepID=A0A1G7ZKL2_9ACTN|nr:SLC13 family permease [Nonomuraea jiangxiensis]SDH09155.1 Dicarboxylate carrier protein MatC N-terminus [Nonomuraea jiangxiensis]
MSAELLSILALVAMFVVATLFPVNLGALALVGAFLVGTLAAGMSTDDILGAFPGSLFVILVGVTLLFAIATNNGTVDWLVRAAVHLVRGRIAAIPPVVFLISALLTAVGAPAPAVAAILAPIAFGFAADYRIHPMLIGLMVAHGTQAGAFSPISVLGGIVNGVTRDANLPYDNISLFLSSFAFNTAAAVIVFFVFGGRDLVSRGSITTEPGTGPGTGTTSAPGTGAAAASPGASPATSGSGGAVTTTVAPDTGVDGGGLRLTLHQALTLIGIVALCLAVLVYQLDVGLTAVTVAVVLSLTSPRTNKGAVERVAWPTVLLICGVVTYVGVLQEIGTVDYVGSAVAAIGIPLLVALLICYVGGVVSAFASTVGILGALVPLAVPLLGQGTLGPIAMIAALSVSSAIVDVSPFSTTGALLVANVRGMERDVFYRRLLTYGAMIVLVGPLAAWAVLVAPGWLG